MGKNKNAQAMARLRWEQTTDEGKAKHMAKMNEALRKKRLLKDIKKEILSPEDKKVHKQAKKERRNRI